jgi:pimeloyl-ACP methyl ester carboxylesterase
MFQEIKALALKLLSRQHISANTVDSCPPRSATQGFCEHLVNIQGIHVFVRTLGDPRNKAVICWHGFARNGSDFLSLGRALSRSYFVICPDTPGRGYSDWINADQYNFIFYQSLAVNLLKEFKISGRVHWIGTSMGGALGMMMASNPKTRRLIDRLVINDIGPEVPQEAIERIREYASESQYFSSLNEARAYFERIYKPFGYLSDEEWALLVTHSVRRLATGMLTQHYDPKILKQFGGDQNPTLAWAMFSSITCRMLLIRGMDSDILPASIADRMVNSAPRVGRLDIANTGHAPFLTTAEQISEIRSFLSD